MKIEDRKLIDEQNKRNKELPTFERLNRGPSFWERAQGGLDIMANLNTERERHRPKSPQLNRKKPQRLGKVRRLGSSDLAPVQNRWRLF